MTGASWLSATLSVLYAWVSAADAIRDGGTKVHDEDTLDELGSITARLEAPEGLKDDRAMAHVLAPAALRFCSVGPAVLAALRSPVAPVDAIEQADRDCWCAGAVGRRWWGAGTGNVRSGV